MTPGFRVRVVSTCLNITFLQRYLGLPVMLKAGEYSPNNPLLARERAPGDALLGLGEYERRRHTLRRIRQQQYREYLDQQAKKKQEAKEQAERERREREEKEREREEREREREREERERERQERESRQEIERERQERDRARRIAERRSPERRRASENYTGHVATFSYNNRVDTGVQVDSVSAPLSVAVQTDDSELFRLPSPCKSQLTQAERELSPHTVAPERPPAAWAPRGGAERRRSLGDFDGEWTGTSGERQVTCEGGYTQGRATRHAGERLDTDRKGAPGERQGEADSGEAKPRKKESQERDCQERVSHQGIERERQERESRQGIERERQERDRARRIAERRSPERRRAKRAPGESEPPGDRKGAPGERKGEADSGETQPGEKESQERQERVSRQEIERERQERERARRIAERRSPERRRASENYTGHVATFSYNKERQERVSRQEIERERQERERARRIAERRSPERRRASENYTGHVATFSYNKERQERVSRQEIERERQERERERQERDRARRIAERRSPERRRASENYTGHVATFSYNNRVDTGVQVDSVSAPLSVAVQTDDSELFRLPSPCKSQLTQAERELSPHTVAPERPPAAWAPRGGAERRRSLGDFDGEWTGTSGERQVTCEGGYTQGRATRHAGERLDTHLGERLNTWGLVSPFQLPSPCKSQLTQAERELSPHTVAPERPPAAWAPRGGAERRRSLGDFDGEWTGTSGERQTLKRATRHLGERLNTWGLVSPFQLPSPCKSQLTQAERELSPHTVAPERPPAAWAPRGGAERRRSLGDFDERSSTLLKKSNRDKLTSDLRHSYMPSIFDADAIQMRNLQAEKEAAARRQFYQQELKNQIMEQQRIREERKSREKMLEQAEMRRLEEQLRMLRVAQDREMDKRHHIDTAIQENKMEYDKKRKELQKDIDNEQLKLLRAPLSTSQLTSLPKRITTSKSDTDTKLPSYFRSNYPRIEREEERQIRPLEKTELPHDINYRLTANEPTQERVYQNKEHSRYSEKSEPYERKPYSMNIPDDSIFSPNYDVDSYLRKNLNFKDRFDFNRYDYDGIGKVAETEKVLVHERPKSKNVPIAKERKSIQDPIDSLPIPVLRHSPVIQSDRVETGSNLSEAMRKIDDKWKVPVVQKNILKSVPNEEGKNVSILTQLGSIRRQLQLEQLKLDMISKDDDV
ncbi:trichohyalin-like [Ostrinia furnacalis]|uniref:trichohyalin-like n=1 Tax=Ostrinia furnacalis TaxID=93504 RepID=UPI00103B4276|nr:trichohyalin-like [Ostrinia furnacalis]